MATNLISVQNDVNSTSSGQILGDASSISTGASVSPGTVSSATQTGTISTGSSGLTETTGQSENATIDTGNTPSNEAQTTGDTSLTAITTGSDAGLVEADSLGSALTTGDITVGRSDSSSYDLSDLDYPVRSHNPVSINGVEFDVLLSLKPTYTADVPEYAMENGAYTSDSILRKPMELTLSALIAEKPVTYAEVHSGRTVKQVADELLDLYFAGELVTVVTPDDVYENMGITNLSMPRDDYLDAMEVSITVKQVNVTEAETSEYDYDGESMSADSTSTSETTDSEETSKSILASIGDAVGDLIGGLFSTD